MITNKNLRSPATVTLLIVVPIIAAAMIFIPSCSKNKKSVEDTIAVPPPPPPPPAAETGSEAPFEVVDEIPIFKGGEVALIDYLTKNTRYPEAAKSKGIQGKVIVQFAVESDGSINRISVLKGVDPELDKEAVRVIGTLPDFEKSGIKDGKAVAVWYSVPINFALR